MAASKQGHHKVVSTLLEHGAHVHARADNGTTALNLAQANNHKRVVEMLKVAGARE